MKFNQLFRYLIVAQAVIFVAAIVFGMDESASMPVELQEYYNKAPEIENLLFLMIMGVGVLIMYFVSIVKLYRFKNSGRILFLIVLFLELAIGPFVDEVIIQTNFTYILDCLDSILYGAIIVLMYTEPLNKQFEQNKLNQTQTISKPI